LTHPAGVTEDPHSFLSSWQPGTKPCGSPHWIGVQCSCNATTCHITGIDLGSAGLKGTLSPAIGTFSQLKVFWINGNRFSGQLPDTVGNLVQMTGWSTRGNQFSGPLPASIENLTKLEYLLAQYNFHSGPLPEQLAKLKQLDWINLAFNQFIGACHCAVSSLALAGVLQCLTYPSPSSTHRQFTGGVVVESDFSPCCRAKCSVSA
jgi:hypothetical protein